MEFFATFLSIVLIIVMLIFGVLQIILFFKIWKMTNDVSKILNEQKESKNEIIDQMRKIVSFLAQNKIKIEKGENV